MTQSFPGLRQSAVWQRVFRARAEDTLPHTINHHRIYIVPSKRGLAFILTLLLMLIASVNYSLSLGYALCFLLTGLFTASLLHTYRNLAGIRVTQISHHDAFAGESVQFTIALSASTGSEHRGIRVRAGDTRTQVDIAPQGQTIATLDRQSVSRGVMRLGRLTLQSDWPLGLWTCWSYLHVVSEALVFPHPEKDAPPLPTDSGSQEGSPTFSAQTGDVSGLRDYQPGDSIGSIAWKSAARGLGLQSRTFDDEHALATTVLDLRLAQVPGLEAQLSRLCAWVMLAEESQTRYAFKLADTSLATGIGQNQREQALNAMAVFGLDHDKAA